MLRSVSRWFVFVVLSLALLPAFGQGKEGYYNVESPQVHPIEVATIGGHDYLLVVNTPDNALEVWDTDESLPLSSRFLLRLPVGLEPVSVRWVPELERAYVANFLGDSITQIVLSPSDGALPIHPVLVGTEQVTDEPLDMAFAFTTVDGVVRPVLFVTHMTLDAIGKYDAKTLRPIQTGSERLDAVVDTGADIDFDGMIDSIALKEPRSTAIACNRLFVLGQKGGNTIRYDFDLYSEDLGSGANVRALGGLGSTNSDMAFASNGDLFVVGGMARNTLRDEPTVAAAATGFVKSMFWMVEDACSDTPTIRSRDVNLKKLLVQQALPRAMAGAAGAMGPVQTQPVTGPVNKNKALAQLTDVVPFEQAGSVSKVFFTAFSSDRIGIIVPNANTSPINWPIRRINVAPLSSPTAGPRGMVLRAPAIGGINTPRLYVLNRFDNSVTIVDPVAETVVETFALKADPTPAHIAAGRRFLYDAKLSGNGFVSCSSCHVDGRTDSLAWDLGGGPAVPIPREIMPGPNFSGGLFPGDKEFMVTQSLQGLLNWEVPQESQTLFTNAPYHWRGDRASFLDFNGAFESLLGGSQLTPGEMAAYENFINSVHYPPNPQQPRDRVHTGELGDPDDNDTNFDIDGEGALLGLKIYHIANSDGRPCALCHALPDGSDNVLTESIGAVNPHPVPSPPLNIAPRQPQETSALRMLFQKEARLDRTGNSPHEDSPITGYEGMMHTGLMDSIASPDFNGTASLNAFNKRFFSGRFCNPGDLFCKNLRALNEFVHQMDSGTAPMVGRAYTVTEDNAAASETLAAFLDLEGQAHVGNAGAVAHLWADNTVRGFWYDLTVDPPAYREEPGGIGLKRTELLALVDGTRDRLALASVPLGTERRMAHGGGTPAVQQGNAPAAVKLLPMVTNDAYQDVPKLSVLWDNGNFNFGGTHAHTVRLYQKGLLNNGPPGGFGLCSVRHAAPRRFSVSGTNLRHGAELHLFIQNDPDNGPPDTTLGPEDQGLGQVLTMKVELPLHPTNDVDPDGQQVWETAAELEPRLFFRLMAGRPDQTGLPTPSLVNVTDRDHLFAFQDEDQQDLFDPVAWNIHYVRVVNTDGTQFDAGWLPVSIEPGPDCP